MAAASMTAQDFRAAVEKHGILFVDFWAAWCGPCRAFAPVYDEVSREHPDILFAKVDTDQERELSASFQIQSIPTLMVFRDGVLLFAQPGALPKSALLDLVKQARALDMARVRKEIEQAQATGAAGHGPGDGPRQEAPASTPNDEAAGESEA
jgi:thioredoxin 1